MVGSSQWSVVLSIAGLEIGWESSELVNNFAVKFEPYQVEVCFVVGVSVGCLCFDL